MTPKQQRFAEEYAIDHNATQAAIRAGYSEASAYAQGSRLLKNAEVREHLNGIQSAVTARTELTVAGITERLLTIANKSESMNSAPGMNVARQAMMDAAKLNGLVVESSEIVVRSPEERAARRMALMAERERIARAH